MHSLFALKYIFFLVYNIILLCVISLKLLHKWNVTIINIVLRLLQLKINSLVIGKKGIYLFWKRNRKMGKRKSKTQEKLLLCLSCADYLHYLCNWWNCFSDQHSYENRNRQRSFLKVRRKLSGSSWHTFNSCCTLPGSRSSLQTSCW